MSQRSLWVYIHIHIYLCVCVYSLYIVFFVVFFSLSVLIEKNPLISSFCFFLWPLNVHDRGLLGGVVQSIYLNCSLTHSFPVSQTLGCQWRMWSPTQSQGHRQPSAVRGTREKNLQGSRFGPQRRCVELRRGAMKEGWCWWRGCDCFKKIFRYLYLIQ